MSSTSLTVLAVSGSLRRGSHNTRLLAAAARCFPVTVRCVECSGLEEIPPFNEDLETEPPPSVVYWRDAIHAADGVLFATPEYNASLPGWLKNAIDWASRPAGSCALRNKNVAVIGASTGLFGAAWAQADARRSLATAGARVLDRELAIPLAAEQFDEVGDLADGELQTSLAEVIAAFLHEIQVSRTLAAGDQVSMGGTLL